MPSSNQRPILLALAAISVVSLMTAAYWYGKKHDEGQGTDRMTRAPSTLLLGRIVRVEPLHLYVQSAEPADRRTFDVLIAPHTALMRLVPWEPGELETAQQSYRDLIARMKPAPGDPIPRPPMTMKAVAMSPSALVSDMMIGVRTDGDINSGKPIVALVVRPLTEKEVATGQVAVTFPYN